MTESETDASAEESHDSNFVMKSTLEDGANANDIGNDEIERSGGRSEHVTGRHRVPTDIEEAHSNNLNPVNNLNQPRETLLDIFNVCNSDEISINNYMATQRDRPGVFSVHGPRQAHEPRPNVNRATVGNDVVDSNLPVATITEEIVAYPVVANESLTVENLTEAMSRKKKHSKRMWTIFALLHIVIVTAVLTSIYIKRRPKRLKDESKEVAALRANLLFFNVSSNVDLLSRDSPQYKALDWMANIDNNTKTVAFRNKLVEDPKAALAFDSYIDHPLIQRYALATLYFSTNGQFWLKQAQFLSHVDECEWKDQEDPLITRIQCGNETNNETPTVKEIHLYSINASGKFPDEIGLFSNLETFFMGDSSIRGTIPSSFGTLTNLVNVHISFGELTGTLPYLGDLQKVEFFSAWKNNLRGSIPTDIQKMKSLSTIHLGFNLFVGTIPDIFGDLTNLERFYANENELVGGFPPSLQTVTKLRVLSLGSNRLQGSIPDFFGGFTVLSELKLNDNEITGMIPESFGNMSFLQSVDLSRNEISGTVPQSFLKLLELENVDLSFNQITGNVDFLCDAKEPQHTQIFADQKFISFKADCLSNVICTCCTLCT